jgi:hypothetical protein
VSDARTLLVFGVLLIGMATLCTLLDGTWAQWPLFALAFLVCLRVARRW